RKLIEKRNKVMKSKEDKIKRIKNKWASRYPIERLALAYLQGTGFYLLGGKLQNNLVRQKRSDNES
ncbi:MAG: hypothetical protein ACK42Y_08020, partial [Candidatus Thermochlorobacter sp.]